MYFSNDYLNSFYMVLSGINQENIEKCANIIKTIKDDGGRLFFIGNGGGSAHCSHAVNDFRKIAEIECYAPSDNVAELSAGANDEGFEKTFDKWLSVSKLNEKDGLIVLSVGGGNKEEGVSTNIVNAIDYGKTTGCKIIGIVGKDGGYSAQHSNEIILIPTVDNGLITPFVESAQSVILHLLVSHPLLKKNQTRWESLE